MREDNMFLNSTSVFIEYYDIIKSPWFTVMQANKDNPRLNEIFDMSPIEKLSDAALYEWYKNRHNINPFKDLVLKIQDEGFDPDILMDTFLEKEPRYVYESKPLEFVNALKTLLKQQFKTTYYIYTPEPASNAIRTDMESISDYASYKFLSGGLITSLKEVDRDCTYILSDVNKVRVLFNSNRLNCSSVLVAQDYAYNHENGLLSPFKVKYEEFIDKMIFKGAYFTASKIPSEYKITDLLNK